MTTCTHIIYVFMYIHHSYIHLCMYMFMCVCVYNILHYMHTPVYVTMLVHSLWIYILIYIYTYIHIIYIYDATVAATVSALTVDCGRA